MTTRSLQVHDVRLGGSWTLAQSLKNSVLRRMIVCALAVADRLPEKWLVRLGRGLGRLAHLIMGAARHRARARLERALPHRDAESLARACFEHAGESLAVCVLLRRPGVRALDLVRIDPSATERLREALALGRGAVVVSAHHGPFELVAATVAELGLRPAAVVRESYDPALDSIVDAHRTARGVRVIHRGKPGASILLLRALREGMPVGILPDLGGRLGHVAQDFLGARVAFPVGPARLAARSGAPLIAVWLSRTSAEPTYELRATLVDPRGHERVVTHRVVAALESAILSQPQLWLWMAAEIAPDRT